MYSYMNGKIQKVLATHIVLECNNIGYLIKVPNPYSFSENVTTCVHLHLIVREDAHDLYGFLTDLERDMFINKKYYRLVRRYFGPKVACDKQIAYEWMRIPHFYTCFYVYKYATCISAASAIVKRIENEGKAYVDKYIDFLKCGDSKSPLDSLLVAGIDMTNPEVVNGAIEDFADCVKQFDEIYSKRK